MGNREYFVNVEIEFRDDDGTLVKIGTMASKRFDDNAPDAQIVHDLLTKAEDTAYNVLERRLRTARHSNTDAS